MNGRLDSTIVLALLGMGHTQAEIARSYGVSRQYVSQLAKQGGHEDPWRAVTEAMPWDVPGSLTDNTLYKLLRRHAFYQIHGPEAMKPGERAKVEKFNRSLRVLQQVVDYDLSYEAEPGFWNTEGFAKVPRTKKDKDYIIKIQPGMKLNRTQQKVWRILPDT